ncbi:right-handed parallel beta-helix repeat-containing protein [Georgenia soli]|uniref:right-handed parallel beta-helix repeat-containing protein n=1 Tax=Georgenia soli TaxID=638953 RepID=UPI001475EFE7|nr:right-handed parallel beta-helix repeat-containing protein [Georgenia soli]
MPVVLALLLGSVGVVLALTSADPSTTPAADGGVRVPGAPREVRTLHVSPDGDDDGADGTAERPLRTIGAAVRASDDGDTVVVHAGTYRESLKIEGRPGLRLVAAPGEEVWLDGSVVVTDWVRDGAGWVSGGWTAEFDSSPTYSWGKPDNDRPGWGFLDPKHPMAAHPDQVWVDGERQAQVGSRAEVRPGTFYVDTGRDELVLGTDPGGRTVTASTEARALRVRSAGMLVRGIGVRNYAPSVPHMGAVTVEAPDVTFEDVTVTGSATTAVHVLSTGVKLQDMVLENSGMMGLSATEADGLELVRVTARGNNAERFNHSPAAGGAKIGRSAGVVVRDSVFEGNLANGLWFDESVHDIQLLRTRVLDNVGHGVSVELSGRATIAGNVIARNQRNGLKLTDTEDVQVWNNTFADNNRSINVVQDDRDIRARGSYSDPDSPLTWRTQTVAIRNNVIAHTGTAPLTSREKQPRTCLLCVEDFSGRWTAAEMDVTALGNVYQRPDADSPRWLVVWARRDKDPYVFRDVPQFRETALQEQTGVELTGPSVLTEDLGLRPGLERLSGTVAQPLPEDVAQQVGQPAGSRHLGAWTS